MRTRLAVIAMVVVIVAIGLSVVPRSGRAASTSLPSLGTFDLATTAPKIADFVGGADRLYCLTSVRNSDGSIGSELIIVSVDGMVLNRLTLAAGRRSLSVRVSSSGKIAVLQNPMPTGLPTILVYSANGGELERTLQQDGILGIAFVGEVLVGIKYGQVLVLQGANDTSGVPQNSFNSWIVDNLGPFYVAGTPGKLLLVDPIQARLQEVNLQRSAASAPYPLDIPELDRGSFGPDEGVLSHLAAASDGTLYCGVSHSMFPEGARVAVIDSAGVTRALLKCQLPTFPELSRRVNMRGYMLPGFLAVTDQYLFWLDPKSKKVSRYSRRQ